MRIGELGRSVGLDVETIRYYEKTGLLPAPERLANGYRKYGRAHVERLAFIRHCRALDMPLAMVQRLLAHLDEPDSDCGDLDELIDAQLKRVRARMDSLRALEGQLAALRRRCRRPPEDKHTAAECGIFHDLVSAARGEACACHRDDNA